MTEELLGPCDPEVFQHGEVVCVFHTTARRAEAWVQMVRAFPGERVDWSYAAGYCVVRCWGNRRYVENTISNLRTELGDVEHFRMVPSETGWRWAWSRARAALRAALLGALLASCQGERPALVTGGVAAGVGDWDEFRHKQTLPVMLQVWDLGVELIAMQNAQVRIDTSVLLCEIAGGVFEKGVYWYHCWRGGEIFWSELVGPELMWWRMHDETRKPPKRQSAPELMTPPWMEYAP